MALMGSVFYGIDDTVFGNAVSKLAFTILELD